MNIAVLSGKGGTGKTFISVNLAAAASNATYLDCDVEEPNGHLFFKPEGVQDEEISVKIPKVDEELCNGCRRCVDFGPLSSFRTRFLNQSYIGYAAH